MGHSWVQILNDAVRDLETVEWFVDKARSGED